MSSEYRPQMRTYGHPSVKYYKPMGTLGNGSESDKINKSATLRNKSKPKEVNWRLMNEKGIIEIDDNDHKLFL